MSRKVLVVDDDPVLRTMFCRHFKRLGFDALIVPDPDAARDLARRMSFAVVMTDYHLEGANGLDLLEDLTELQPDASAILMSGDPSVEEGARLRGLTRAAILHKPFTATNLADLLRDALARHLVREAARDRDEDATTSAAA